MLMSVVVQENKVPRIRKFIASQVKKRLFLAKFSLLQESIKMVNNLVTSNSLVPSSN